VKVYDGYTTRDTVLLHFCGGGAPVPAATSSGPELLVEFTTSPFGTFVANGPGHALHGFQLQVEVNHQLFGTSLQTLVMVLNRGLVVKIT